eukprot:3847210-Amphidinium_carterae.1
MSKQARDMRKSMEDWAHEQPLRGYSLNFHPALQQLHCEVLRWGPHSKGTQDNASHEISMQRVDREALVLAHVVHSSGGTGQDGHGDCKGAGL